MALSKKPVNGMKDIMPDEMKIRDYLIDLIKKTYREFGFTPMAYGSMASMNSSGILLEASAGTFSKETEPPRSRR